MRTLNNFIHGEWATSASTEFVRMLNPATEEELGSLPAGSAADVDTAVQSALSAAAAWAGHPLESRLNMLNSVAAAVSTHAEELAALECDEMGRPVAVGRSFIDAAVASLQQSIEDARRYDFVREIANNVKSQTLVIRHSLGVVGLIVPWNFTVYTILSALGPLLAAGNTVVLKPSEKASLSAERMLQVIDLPPGVLNMVLGDGRAGAALSEHPSIGLTHFTGSINSGRAVALASATNLRRAVLELGGKDPVLIDADVDVAATAEDVAVGSFLNTGQICTAMERIYVHRDIAAPFIEALVAEAQRFTHGNGRDPSVRVNIQVRPEAWAAS